MAKKSIKVVLRKVGTSWSADTEYKLLDYIVVDGLTMYVCRKVDESTNVNKGHALTETEWWDVCTDLSSVKTSLTNTVTTAVNNANTATSGAEKVNASLNGTTLTITDRTGTSKTITVPADYQGLVQELGTSTTSVMSQNAVTDALKQYALYGIDKEVSVKSGYRLNNYKEYAADGWYLTDFIPVTAGHKFHVVCGGSGYGTLHAGEFFKADKSTGVSGFSLYVYKNGNSEEVEVPEGAEYMRICSDCAYIEYTDLTTKTTTDGEVLMNAHYSTVDFEVLGTTLTSAGEETGTDDARWNCTSKIPMKKGEKFHIYTSNNQSGANGGFFLFGTDGVVVDSYFKSMSFPENFVAPYDGYFRIGMCALNTGLTLGFDITKFSSTLASAKKRINKTIHTRGHSFWVIDGHSYTKFDKKQTIRGFQTIFNEQFKFADFDSIAYDGHSLGAQSTSDTSSIALKLTSWTGSEGDIWTLDTVTNDFKRNIPLGTISDYNADSPTALTYYGALKIFANKISELSGDTAIVLVANASHRNNGGYTSTSKNTAGYGLSDYSNALMTIAELNGWYFVDVFNYSGITDDNIDITTYDGLHPTNLGFKLLATTWVAQLDMVYNKLL